MEPLNPYTIIVADDDNEDRDLFCELFTHDAHFTLLGCLTSGLEVFDEISRKNNIPDVLLIDMYMPFFSGIDLIKRLEELHAAPNMYKFIISTTTNIAENEPQLNSPYIVYLKKPASMQEINALPGIILGYLQQQLGEVS